MATQTHEGTVVEVSHAKSGSVHVYSAKVKYDVANPSPPPPTIEEVMDHEPIDKEFYDDFRAAFVGGKTVKTTYDDGAGKPVSAVTIK